MRNLPRLWISRSPTTKLWKALTAPPAYPQPVAVPYTSLKCLQGSLGLEGGVVVFEDATARWRAACRAAYRWQRLCLALLRLQSFFSCLAAHALSNFRVSIS